MGGSGGPKLPSFDAAIRIARGALEGGGRITAYRIEWDVAGRCENPKYLDMAGHTDARLVGVPLLPAVAKVQGSERFLRLSLDIPCRRCAACRRNRRARWQYWAARELRLSPRSWFGTLTFKPDEVFAANERIVAQGIDIGALGPEELFAAQARELGREVTRYLKRVRKDSGAVLRYLLVTEAHKSRVPHFHALVHEPVIGSCVRQHVLRDQWSAGFSRWKLCDNGAAGYITKYLMKSCEARVRASHDYGKRSLIIDLHDSAGRENFDHAPERMGGETPPDDHGASW